MAFNITEIKSRLRLGGARPNLFQVTFAAPNNRAPYVDVPFMVQAASIPSSDLGVIRVPYFGRTINLGGDRTFDPWRTSIINDEDYKIRRALEEWHDQINGRITNVRTLSSYKTDAQVIHYGKEGNIIKTYTFVGIFPGQISDMSLAWGENDSIQSFAVTWHYDYWTDSTPTNKLANSSAKTITPVPSATLA